MSNGLTDTLLMIEPVCFDYNLQTSVDNHFMTLENKSKDEIQKNALAEFRLMVDQLRSHNINVIVEKDTTQPRTPDSVFPNNWLSFHENNQAVIYPMLAENRRLERRQDIIADVEKYMNKNYRLIDLTEYEKSGDFLEGTGSMVLDRVNKKAYATISERTDKTLFFYFCKIMHYTPVLFKATQKIGDKMFPIYHTNVLMCIADNFSVICLESIENELERNHLIKMLENDEKKIIDISPEQMNAFAGNMLQIKNRQGIKFIALSQTAFKSLNEKQISALSAQNHLIVIPIPTIEKNGGGSVRCMMAEVF